MTRSRIASVVLSIAVILLTGCGGNLQRTQSFDVASVKVAISPATITLDQGASQQFTATVTGSTNTAVTWSVSRVTAGGSINAQGVYTAPGESGTAYVIATSRADPSRTDTAVVTVRAVLLSVSPSVADLQPGETHQFIAIASGCVNQNVTWSIREGATGGSITANGMYTAPANAGTYHIVATSASDSATEATIAVSVAPLAVAIRPSVINVTGGGRRTFTATVRGSMDDRVTWAVQEAGGGAISAEGTYTAPNALGEYHVTAMSVAHPGLFSTATVTVSDSGFSDAGDMTTVRFNHSATLLPNGDVLLAGGWDGTGDENASAELYDQSTGTFRRTGDMTEARTEHTATFLPLNGKVLIAGGVIDGGWGPISLDTAELYDPANGQFAATGKMLGRRHGHTATLLKDGRVLIAGGYWSDEMIATAELYNPGDGSFVAAGSMSQARGGHTATLLPDGRVLILGGGAWMGDNSAEIYDPASGVFTVAGGSFRRDVPTATLLDDGRILLAGGSRWDWGSYTGSVFDDAQFFEPSTGLYRFAGTMNEKRSWHTATALRNGLVLIVGGSDNEAGSSTSELFDPAKSVFVNAATMKVARSSHTATLLQDGSVLIAGGAGETLAEVYTPKP